MGDVASSQLWDLGKGYCVRTMFCYSPCTAVEITGETTRLLCSAHNDRRLRLWDIKTGDQVAEIPDVHAKQAFHSSTCRKLLSQN